MSMADYKAKKTRYKYMESKTMKKSELIKLIKEIINAL